MGQGLNLALCLITATQTKEFNGIHFIFQSALGAMAFAEIDMEFDDLKNIQSEYQGGQANNRSESRSTRSRGGGT